MCDPFRKWYLSVSVRIVPAQTVVCTVFLVRKYLPQGRNKSRDGQALTSMPIDTGQAGTTPHQGLPEWNNKARRAKTFTRLIATFYAFY